MFKPLTGTDLYQVASQIVNEQDALNNWQQMYDWAQGFYGPNATKLSLELQSDSDDEGGSVWSIDSITVYDAAGEELLPDPHAPGWHKDYEKWKPFSYPDQLKILLQSDDLGDDIAENLDDEYIRETYDDLPCEQEMDEFDLTQRPTMTILTLFQEVEDGPSVLSRTE